MRFLQESPRTNFFNILCRYSAIAVLDIFTGDFQEGGCKYFEFFRSKGQRSNLLIELLGSNGMLSTFIVFVVWLGRFAPFAK